jgi:hypothetical protein
MLLTPEDVAKRTSGCFKFVRVGGIYRFAELSASQQPEHKDMVAMDEIPESAGTIFVRSKDWQMSDSHSMTLKISADARSYDDLTKILGKPWEFS